MDMIEHMLNEYDDLLGVIEERDQTILELREIIKNLEGKE